MTSYKKYILQSSMLAAGFCLLGFLVSFLFRVPTSEIFWINNCLIKKESIAKSISQPKIVFIGGSSTLFGVRTKDIQKELNVPTVNLAVHAELQIDYILYRAKKVLKDGDTVILPLEYAHYFYDGKQARLKSCYIRVYDNEYLKQLPIRERLAHIYNTSFDFPESFRNRVISNKEIAVGKRYNSTTLNENGDETYNISDDRTKKKLLNKKPIELKKGDFTETLGLKIIKDFNVWCRQKNIKLYIAYPPTIYFKEYESNEYRDYFGNLQNYFTQNGISIIGAPYDSFFDKSLFYDTEYHLNQTGMTIQTKYFIKKIKELNLNKSVSKAQGGRSRKEPRYP